VPIVQGATGTVTVLFKEFGIRLNFRPTIAGDVIRLKVRPEVSALDFANGITLEGFRIPALTTRRAETDVELRDGQSFAIAGLLDNIRQDDTAAIPILSKLPIIGALFKSKAERAEETELMVLVTPRLVRPLNPDEVPPLPTNIRPLIKHGDIGEQLDGAGGVADAPRDVKPVADKPRNPKPAEAGRN
jgi:pilus assembly protein CpaC